MKLEIYQRLSDGKLFFFVDGGFRCIYLKDVSNSFATLVRVEVEQIGADFEKITEHEFSA